MYALIGYPLGHSFSADFFNTKFEREGIDDSYSLCPLPTFGDFGNFIDSHPDLEGFNVTIPYKRKIIAKLDFITEEAREIGAVNVVGIVDRVRGKAGLPCRLAGYNTDAIGFRESLRPLLRNDIHKALVLGSGGASKAVIYVLESLGISALTVSRHPDSRQISYEDIDGSVMSDHLLIVNTTPVGMSPDVEKALRIPYSLISNSHVCYDLVYNPEKTLFLRNAESRGARIKNGLEMLHLQALAAWNIWTGISRPSLCRL